MPRLSSAAISRIEHDEQSSRLAVWFRGSGKLYVLSDVPRPVYEAFLRAPSAGAFFNRRIRDRFPAAPPPDDAEAADTDAADTDATDDAASDAPAATTLGRRQG